MYKHLVWIILNIILFTICIGFALAGSADVDSLRENTVVSFNGKFIDHSPYENAQICSPNGAFSCQFDIGHVSDEIRQLNNFRFYENNELLFTLDQVPGSDLYISNSGHIAFLDHNHHFQGQLTVSFYSKEGQALFSKTFRRASLFGFSPAGNKFGIGDAAGLQIISMNDQQIRSYPNGYQFAISINENLVAVASENKIALYANGDSQGIISTDIDYPRGVEISPDNRLVAIIGKKLLQVYSLITCKLLFENSLPEKISFRDLKVGDNQIITGAQYRDDEFSKGILKIYDLQGAIILDEIKAEKYIKPQGKIARPDPPSTTYEQIPWPLAPFDSVHTVWNHYEQHMSYGEPYWSYLHQGLDIITGVGEPVYAVAPGIVKCVLTLGGDSYWRTAISPQQSAGWSNGWLYAHLIESSIQFDVGDSIQLHDYLGDIIYWAPNWGHIHFAEIRDTGLVWDYFDNQWGITHNPLLSLTPSTDLVPPVIEDVFSWSKFAFCLNESSTYLNPDSLYGDIDIILKISDYIGDSPWEQPAFETYYWLVSPANQDTAIMPTLGQILNHEYDFFGVDDFVPYATLLYKRDNILLPPQWMDEDRDYYQIMTNNDGDSTVDLEEHELALHTPYYEDGLYRLFVKAMDAYGNSAVDSQDIEIKNNTVDIENTPENGPQRFLLSQNYPNPFNSATRISYWLLTAAQVRLAIYDILGREVRVLVDEYQETGHYPVVFNAAGLPSGIYYYKLQSDYSTEIRKMTYVR